MFADPEALWSWSSLSAIITMHFAACKHGEISNTSSYSLSHKTMNTWENFWNVYCFATNQMRDETAKDNRQTAAWSSHDLTRNNAGCVLFLFQLEKALFFKKPNYRTDLKRNFKIYNSARQFTSFVRRRFPSYKKIPIENHQSHPTSMTFWTACETNVFQHRLWLANLFCPQMRCLAACDPVCLTQHRFSVKYRFYLLFSDT